MSLLCICSSVLLLGCGVSSPTIIASDQANVQSIVTASDAIYWSDFGLDPLHQRVMHAHAGVTDVLAAAQVCPTALATDQTSLFWVRCDGAVASAPVGGGPTALLIPPDASASSSPEAIAVIDDTVYILVDHPGEIIAVPKQGGTATTIVSNLAAPRGLAVDDTNLYWLDRTDAALYQRARTADPGTPPTRLATLDTSTFPLGLALATDGVDLYWSDSAPRHAHAMRLADGTRFELATSGPPAAFALDASHVYWISREPDKVERSPLAGGTTELLAAIDEIPGAAAPTVALTTDAVIFAGHPTQCDPTIMGCLPTTIESVPK